MARETDPVRGGMAEVPQLLGGRYEVGELLGRGGMAEVHLGHDTRLGRTVAIKMLRADLARDPTFQVRFRREAQSAAVAQPPAIVAVYDTGEDPHRVRRRHPLPYIVMEYVEGPTLREHAARARAARAAPRRSQITDGVLAALAYSHRQGIVHRDIKPANVMLDPERRGQGDGLRHRPRDGRHRRHDDPDLGGHRHRAVPLARAGPGRDGRRAQRPLLHRLPALRAAHRPAAVRRRLARSPVAYQHVGEEPPPPSRFDADVAGDLDAIVLQALAKDREAPLPDRRRDPRATSQAARPAGRSATPPAARPPSAPSPAAGLGRRSEPRAGDPDARRAVTLAARPVDEHRALPAIAAPGATATSRASAAGWRRARRARPRRAGPRRLRVGRSVLRRQATAQVAVPHGRGPDRATRRPSAQAQRGLTAQVQTPAERHASPRATSSARTPSAAPGRRAAPR